MITSVFKFLLSFNTVFTRFNFRCGILLLADLKATAFKSLRHPQHMKTPKSCNTELKSSSFVIDCIRKEDFFCLKIRKTTYPKIDKQEVDLL